MKIKLGQGRIGMYPGIITDGDDVGSYCIIFKQLHRTCAFGEKLGEAGEVIDYNEEDIMIVFDHVDAAELLKNMVDLTISDMNNDSPPDLSNDVYPLYPMLPDQAQAQAQELINNFKKELIKVADDAIGNLYCDVTHHIESASWTNFRGHLLDGLCNYNNRHTQGDYDFKRIRRTIYEEYRDEIIADLDQDLIIENTRLKERLIELEQKSQSFY